MASSRPVRLLLVDGLNLIRRVHAGQPAPDEVKQADSAVGASLQSLKRALRDCRPTHAACVFDGAGPTFRHREYPEYKAGRKPMPEPLRARLGDIEAAFTAAGVRCLSVDETEADDVIATLATKVADRGGRVVVLSTDRAFQALIGPRLAVRDHFARRDVSRDDVVTRFGVEPGQLYDYWALVGFSSNGIAGVPGIGPKTAARLLAEHGDLEGVLAVAAVLEGKVGQALREHAGSVRRTRELVRLRTELRLGLNLKNLRLAA